MNSSPDKILEGQGMASALEDPSHPTPVLELVESDSVVDAEVIEDESSSNDTKMIKISQNFTYF